MLVNFGKKLKKKTMELDVWVEGVTLEYEDIGSS
jgi:hypothetical protein